MGKGEEGLPMVITADRATVELALAALESEAERRQRAATRAAGELEVEVASGEISDRRPASVRITNLLIEASKLSRFAAELSEAYAASSRDRDTDEAGEPAQGPTAKAAADDPQVVAAARAQAQDLHDRASALDENAVEDPISASEED